MKLKPDTNKLHLSPSTADPNKSDQLSKSANAAQGVNCKVSAKDIEKLRLLKSNLTRYYRDAPARLNITSIPSCLFNLKHCAAHHSTKEIQLNSTRASPRVQVVAVAVQMLDDGHYEQFTQYARDCILSRSRFPGARIIKALLEAIFIAPTSDLHSLLSTLHTIFLNFPICQWRNCYHRLIATPTQLTKLPTEASADSALFEIILNLLNDLIYHRRAKAETEETDKVNSPSRLRRLPSDDKSTFINLTCDEKFARIHLVLDALAALFEQDLTMFAVKYAGQLSARIGRSGHRPLVCAAMWKSYESVTAISRCIKVVISVYVDMVASRDASVGVIARFVNLIAGVVNMFECADETGWPCYGNLTVVLVREIHWRMVQQKCEKHASKFEFYVEVIEQLKSPLTRMLLVSEVLQKLHNAPELAISLSTVVRMIREREKVLNRDENEEEDSPPASKQRRILRSSAEKQNPRRRRAIRAVAAAMTEDCYLKLLLLFAAAINHFYRVGSCYKEPVQRPHRASSQIALKLDQAAPQKPESRLAALKGDTSSDEEDVAVEVDLNEPLPCRRRYLVPKKSCSSIKLTYETISFYGDEVKQLGELTNLIKKCHRDEQEKFDEWLKFVESV